MDKVIEIPAPSIRSNNLIVPARGDVSSHSSEPNTGSGISSSSLSESIIYSTPGVVVHSSSSSSYRSSSSRSNYSMSEFEEVSGGNAGVSPKVTEGVADDAYIRPARNHVRLN